jgi:hypothetical protein
VKYFKYMRNVESAIPMTIQKGLMEERGFGVFQDRVLRRIFGPGGVGVGIGSDWRWEKTV